ncbi:MAG: trigger factor [Cytophagaceae bacterium SCN 52-12]|nr:MAG: trigger factor [Cytophagaceae bacterium SCN 52-12]
MEVLLEKSSPTTASLKVKLVKEDYQPKVDKSIKDYSKRASIKGFRPGKVPAHVINRMYGRGILVEEVNHLLSHAVNDYIKDNKLPVVGDPMPDREKADSVDWDNQTEFEFSFDLGLAGDFVVDLEQLNGITKYTIQAGESDLDKTIEDLRNRFAENTHPEVSEDGDIIYGELTQEATEFTTKTAIPVKRVKEELRSLFIGIKVGDSVTFDIQDTFEDESAIAHVTGKKKDEIGELSGEFTFKAEDITRNVPAELNDEFYKKVLGFGEEVAGEQEFREKVAAIVQENYNRETEALLRRDIEDRLLEKTPIELPEEFLKKWLYQANEGKFTEEQIADEFDAFAKSLRMSLIRNRVAESHEVKVEAADLLEESRNIVKAQFGIYGEEDSMKETIDKIAQQYLTDRERDNYRKVFQQVFDNKVYELLRGNVTSEEKTVSVSEFEEVVRAEV